MNDKEKLQYLYDKEKAKEKKQERKQGNVLFAGGMVAYLFIAVFKIVVMSFFPLLFFYFILGISGMSLIILSLIAGAIFFYIREGRDVKEEMGNRTMMEEVTNGRLPYEEEELEDNMTENEWKKKMRDTLENNFAEKQKREKELMIEKNNNSNQKSLSIQGSIADACGFALILETDKALNSMPVVRNYFKKHGLEKASQILILRKKFYGPLADDAEELGKIIKKYGVGGAITEESDVIGISENYERAIEIDDDNLLESIFDQAIGEAIKIGRRESYNETIYVLGKLRKHLDYHSEKEWRNHVSDTEEKELQSLRGCGVRSLTENEKREIGLIPEEKNGNTAMIEEVRKEPSFIKEEKEDSRYKFFTK